MLRSPQQEGSEAELCRAPGVVEISTGDFREQIELAGIQGSDAADMLSIWLLGYRTIDLSR